MKVHIALQSIALLIGALGSAAAANSEASPACWPLNFAGVTLGVNDESEVTRLLGAGVRRADEGDMGGRYYIDPDRTATLHVEFVTDSVVGELTVQEGVSPQLGPGELVQAQSEWFVPRAGFGNWHALQLGSSKKDVIANLGTPERGAAGDAWQYQSACACEIPQYFTLHFRSDRIHKVVFSAPAG